MDGSPGGVVEAVEVQQLQVVFAEELQAQGVVLTPDEEELILKLCVNTYRAERDGMRCA
jgi:hypothetical protein